MHEKNVRESPHTPPDSPATQTCLDAYFALKVVKYDLRLETITVILTGWPSEYRAGLFKFRSR